MIEIKGNLHIHSTYSDGHKSIPEIAGLAQEASLDFILINDHSHLLGLERGEEGWYGKTLVLIGCEINDRKNHYLAYGINQPVPGNDDNPQEVIDEVNRQGGFGFLAHPFEKGSPLSDQGWAYKWENWEVRGYTGICIWNYTAHWKGKAQNIPKGLYYYYNRKAAFTGGPDSQTLATWDRECLKRKVVAIAGSDAHEVFYRWYIFSGTIFHYSFLFKALNVHLLLETALSGILEMDKKMIYNSLREGNSFICHDYLAPGKGFRFMAVAKDQSFPMGSEVGFSEDIYFLTEAPEICLMTLIKNGKVHRRFKGKSWEVRPAEKGVYRLEAQLTGFLKRPRAWIFSNPIWLS
ncbi:MAG: histidinol-phosphatase [Candidatus Tectomicrobia bacterium]|uniref:Histidinol-phosphatase n=1 Tax=Tectimicrobiota bacterium TaxID=2528274 RepID=A0A933GQG3_UNCTE|nr:histidinol-phosphatase [Candidatus Tectomicrobia bacterium]